MPKSRKHSTVFVTGGCGFMGSDFVRYLLSQKNYKVINLDKLTYAGNLDNLKSVSKNPNYKFIKGDIADKECVQALFKKYKPDYVVNFAAETHVDRSIHESAEPFLRTNILGVYSLLEAVRQNKSIKKFVHISTDEVYGDTDFNSKKKFNEQSPLRPSNPYASSKASGDLLCLAYFRTYGLPVIISRSGNNFGPYQYPEKLIPFFILNLIEGKKVPLYGRGKNIRTWVYVRDHSRAVLKCLKNGKAGEIYNINSNEYLTNKQVALKILGHFNKNESRIKYVKDRPGHDRRYAPDPSKIIAELRWMPLYDFDKYLADTIAWYRENKNWINRAKRKFRLINRHIK